MQLVVLSRHAHSTLNRDGRINGDPRVLAPLTPEGRVEAGMLGLELAAVALDLCVHTRFGRTIETADRALAGRSVPRVSEPLLDDVDVGELEGESIEQYRAWKREHRRAEPFPGGESIDDAALRYAAAFRMLLERPERTLLVVCHEIPIRYAVNAAGGSDDLDGPAHTIPNATPYLFDEEGLERAATRIEQITRSGGRAQAHDGE